MSMRVGFVTFATFSDIGIYRMVVEMDAKATRTFLGIGLTLGHARASSYTL